MHFTCRIMQYMQSFETILPKSSSLFCKKENCMNSYFQVVDGNALYRPVGNDFKIMFTLKTSIKEIKETDIDIPHHKFEFVDYNKIHERVNKHVQLLGISIYIMRYIKFFNNYALYYCYI